MHTKSLKNTLMQGRTVWHHYFYLLQVYHKCHFFVSILYYSYRLILSVVPLTAYATYPPCVHEQHRIECQQLLSLYYLSITLFHNLFCKHTCPNRTHPSHLSLPKHNNHQTLQARMHLHYSKPIWFRLASQDR